MLESPCCSNTTNTKRVGNMSKGKYHDVLLCEGCGEAYIDSDGGCTKYCVECEHCSKMTEITKLDATLLLEADLEICNTCAALFLREVKKVVEHVRISDMGDHKGNKRNV